MVQIIPDQPSAAALRLRITNDLELEDIIIFGTGHQLGIRTVTADRRAIREMWAQRLRIAVDYIPSVNLAGL
jgi:hypothetical protein